MNLTRILPLALSLALLAGCSGGDKPALSAEARTQLYEPTTPCPSCPTRPTSSSPSIWISWA